MAKEALAVKYRPKTFDSLTEQSAIKIILEQQIETKSFQHAYLFTGPAGCGKTTSARIFANKINEEKGNPIEVDAASNSGVDNIRNIIEDAKRKSLDSEYKVFIIDECHSLSSGSWQALLKLLEEPPKFTIFILCTTNPEKIPATIMSRVQRYQFNKISTDGIVDRLKTICNIENKDIMEEYGDMDSASDIEWARVQKLPVVDYDENSLSYIAKQANGGMRDAITMMDKCLSLSTNLTVENVVKAIGTVDYAEHFQLLEYLTKKDSNCILVVENVFNAGKDIKLFLKNFHDFVLDVCKFKLFGSFETTRIPALEEYYTTAKQIDESDCFKVLRLITDLIPIVKYDSNALYSIEGAFALYCKESD